MAEGRNCGNPFDNGERYGPFDYTDPARKTELNLVEIAHFTPYMQDLAVNGSSAMKPEIPSEQGNPIQVVGSNLDYTLDAFPNHHKALYAMGIWQLRLREAGADRFSGAVDGELISVAECYFQKAIQYGDDAVIRQAYGAFLHRARDLRRAEEQYLASLQLLPDNAEAHYNLGLLYVDMKRYADAEEQAKRANELGFPLQGLTRKLNRARAGGK
jgi:tetratricopeptide (TPR) repeat protein